MKRMYPCVLAFGGLDPGGGAGVLADARAIEFAGAFACAVVTLQTVQSTRGLVAAHAVRHALWAAQARTVLVDQRVRALKTGALGTRAAIEIVAAIADDWPELPLVVDPVMLPSRGHGQLLSPRALDQLKRRLIARATVVTANVHEAAVLAGFEVATIADAERAARAIVTLGARSALVKGGHLERARGTDILAIDGGVTRFDSKALRLGRMHGTGCTFASLVAARLATSNATHRSPRATIENAIGWSKERHHAALTHAADVGEVARVVRFGSSDVAR